jgi:hypothetical protein
MKAIVTLHKIALGPARAHTAAAKHDLIQIFLCFSLCAHAGASTSTGPGIGGITGNQERGARCAVPDGDVRQLPTRVRGLARDDEPARAAVAALPKNLRRRAQREIFQWDDRRRQFLVIACRLVEVAPVAVLAVAFAFEVSCDPMEPFRLLLANALHSLGSTKWPREGGVDPIGALRIIVLVRLAVAGVNARSDARTSTKAVAIPPGSVRWSDLLALRLGFLFRFLHVGLGLDIGHVKQYTTHAFDIHHTKLVRGPGSILLESGEPLALESLASIRDLLLGNAFRWYVGWYRSNRCGDHRSEDGSTLGWNLSLDVCLCLDLRLSLGLGLLEPLHCTLMHRHSRLSADTTSTTDSPKTQGHRHWHWQSFPFWVGTVLAIPASHEALFEAFLAGFLE